LLEDRKLGASNENNVGRDRWVEG